MDPVARAGIEGAAVGAGDPRLEVDGLASRQSDEAARRARRRARRDHSGRGPRWRCRARGRTPVVGREDPERDRGERAESERDTEERVRASRRRAASGGQFSMKDFRQLAAARVAELAERLRLDLADALAGHLEVLPDLFEGVVARARRCRSAC